MATDDKTESEPTAPRPPARGTEDYRRMVLWIGAAEGPDEFLDRIVPPWEWLGWRLGIDVMSEYLYGIVRAQNLREYKFPRDAFGRIPITHFMDRYSEEKRLVAAADMAKAGYGNNVHLPRHERFRTALEDSKQVWDTVERLVPVCQQALNAIDAAGRPEAAAPILLKYLNSRDDRVVEASKCSSVMHAHLRYVSMPPGEDWIEDFLRAERSPDLDLSSAAFYQRQHPDDSLSSLPDWMQEQREAVRADKEARRPKKGRRSRPPGCTCPH